MRHALHAHELQDGLVIGTCRDMMVDVGVIVETYRGQDRGLHAALIFHAMQHAFSDLNPDV